MSDGNNLAVGLLLYDFQHAKRTRTNGNDGHGRADFIPHFLSRESQHAIVENTTDPAV